MSNVAAKVSGHAIANEFRILSLELLKLSDTDAQAERRRHLDKAKIEELSESIKTVGMLQPIVVRPCPFREVGEELFEIVAGERRYLAAKHAKFETINAVVRDLTDEQVLEIQLVENLQRQDLHELAEAEGYEGLQKLGYTAEEIADKVGKSKGTVYARMKLLALCKEARKAFYEGKLNSSTALLIARIPDEKLQKEALKEITTPRWGDEVLSVREASRHIHDHYMLRLSGAGFKTEDATLVPAAGACGVCLKRTGNQKELFGDVKSADVCTDPVCFRAKLSAHAARTLSQAQERGQEVLTGKDAKKVSPNGSENNLRGYVRLDAKNYDDKKYRTYRELLGKKFVPTLLHVEGGAVIEVAPESALKGLVPARAANINPQSAQEKKAKLESAYRTELFKQVRAASMVRSAKLLRAELEEAALRLFERLDHDTKKRLFKALEWETGKGRNGGVSFDPPIEITEMQDAELAQFMRDCTLAPDLYVPTWSNSKPEYLEDAAADLKINTKKIRESLADAARAKAKKKPAKAAKKNAARKAK